MAEVEKISANSDVLSISHSILLKCFLIWLHHLLNEAPVLQCEEGD